MDNIPPPERLEALGLSHNQARAYLTLLRLGSVGAAQVAEAAGLTRSSAYAALRSLADLALVEAGAGYGSRFRAAPPEDALPGLVERQREAMAQQVEERERLAKELSQDLSSIHAQRPLDLGEVVEIVRDRRAVAERFDRIQLEAREEMVATVKMPILTGGDPNPAQEVAMDRGVRVLALYEAEVLDHPEIRPYLKQWHEAGEEMRVHPGPLPLKYEVMDGRVCMLPLETPGDRSPVTTLIIRHEALGAALRLLYDFLWEQAEPFEP